MAQNIGELAALAVSLCFALSSMFFSVVGKRIGSVNLNRIRLVVATLILLSMHWLMLGVLLPVDAAPERWFWLGISGVVGLVLGDAFLFQAYVWVGPRLTMLMMSLAPAIAALTAWVFMGEALSGLQLGGGALTLGGIAWVVADKNTNGGGNAQNPHYLRGLLFGLGAAAGQALGLVLAKQGVYGGFPALSGTTMRMVCGAAVMWALTLLRGQAGATFQKLASEPRTLRLILAGAFFGPSLGITLSLFAVQHTSVGIASTLMALPPVFLLPLSYFVFKERFGWGAVAGTLVAVVGVGMLFLA